MNKNELSTLIQVYSELAQLKHQVFSENLKAFENYGGWTQTVIKASHCYKLFYQQQ